MELLDNNENGVVDDSQVVDAAKLGLITMWPSLAYFFGRTTGADEWSTIHGKYTYVQGIIINTDMQLVDTDAPMDLFLTLVFLHEAGYAEVYDDLKTVGGSALEEATYAARKGDFDTPP